MRNEREQELSWHVRPWIRGMPAGVPRFALTSSFSFVLAFAALFMSAPCVEAPVTASIVAARFMSSVQLGTDGWRRPNSTRSHRSPSRVRVSAIR